MLVSSVLLAFAMSANAAAPLPPVQDSWEPGTKMMSAFKTCLDYAVENRKILKQVTLDPEVCVLGTMLDPKASASYTRTLRSGEFYTFITAADDAESPMSIEVTNSDGEVVAKTDESSAVGYTYIQVDNTGEYTIKVTADKESGDANLVALTIQSTVYKQVSQITVEQTLRPFKAINTRVAQALGDTGKNLRFRQGDSQWCLIGGVPAGSTSVRIPEVQLGDTGGFFIGGGNNTNNINLVVKKGDDVTGEETSKTAFVGAGESGTYSAEIFNKGAARAVCVLAVVVE
jgi:hypothetical protein